MTAAAGILFAAAAAMFLAPVTVAAFVWVAERRADRAAKRRAAEGREIGPEWLAVLAATEPSLSAHPSAGRIRDLIAANEAARIDREWEAMNR